MKKSIPLFLALTAISVIILFTTRVFCAVNTWYISPTGSDSNSGTQNSPFNSITKAQLAAKPGDIVYIMGGTYTNFNITSSDSNYNYFNSITKSGITYQALNNEKPIFDFSKVTTAKRVAAFHIKSGVTVTFKGFEVIGVPVGNQKQSECFRIEGEGIFENVACHDNNANGFYFTNNGKGSCTNCDSYNNIGIGNALSNTDGFGAHGNGVTFKNCRAWNCSDDGYDCIASYGSNIFDNCWAFNMKNGGDSNGFKIGGWGSTNPPNKVPVHTVKNCLSANNKAHGFYANHQCGQAAIWTNNTAYNNASGNYNMLERVSPTDSSDIPGTREILQNNIAFKGTIIKNANLPAANVNNNSWSKSGVIVDENDFVSLDINQLSKPRTSDGSLPEVTFMKLTSNSDLQGMGCFN